MQCTFALVGVCNTQLRNRRHVGDDMVVVMIVILELATVLSGRILIHKINLRKLRNIKGYLALTLADNTIEKENDLQQPMGDLSRRRVFDIGKM